MSDKQFDEAVTTNEYIRAITRQEAKVEALTESMRELKRAVEELIDRVDADIDTLRTKTEAFSVIGANVVDIQRRMTILETKVEAATVDHTELKASAGENTRRVTVLETKIEAMQYRVYFASGAVGVVVWLATRLLK